MISHHISSVIILSLCVVRLQISALSVISRELKPYHDRQVACYYSSWAVYREGRGKFGIENIDPALCTNLIYAFAGLDTSTSSIKSLDPFNDLEDNYGKGSYKKINELRKQYPHLTVSLAIGGWNEGSTNYSELAKDSEKRRIFVNSVFEFLSEYGFNGFDLDWEYPTKRGGAPEDRENFVKLVKELHEKLKPSGMRLTAALGAGKDTVESAYDLAELDKYLDYVHLMCYDYHGIWEDSTGANAPLHPSQPGDINNVEFSVQFVLDHGLSPSKLLLGLPMYGRTFMLDESKVKNTTGDRLGAPSLKTAFSGPYTKQDGFMGYNEICAEMNETAGWKKMWDDSTMTPFSRNGDKIITYDDEKSLAKKVEYAMIKKLGGVMIWSIETDDFMNDCGHGRKFPLLSSVNEAVVTSLQEIHKAGKESSSTSTSKPPREPEEPNNSTITTLKPPSKPEKPSSAPSLIVSIAVVFMTCFICFFMNHNM